MKFHEWETLWEQAIHDGGQVASTCTSLGKSSFYKFASDKWRKAGNALESNMALFELQWWEDSRPYYKVFPCIIKALENVKLDLACEHVPNPPFQSMVLRYSEGNRFFSVFFNLCSHKDWPTGYRQLSAIACGKSKMALGLSLIPGTGIEDGLCRANVDRSNAEVAEVVIALRHAITVCLLANDHSVITPDVLGNDRDRYDSETDEAWKQRAVDRARRRGVVGWNIGADYEVCPHYRRPHFGIRHTGKGRTVPRIVPIKGAVVHRSRLTEVPTGWMDEDGKEIEPK